MTVSMEPLEPVSPTLSESVHVFVEIALRGTTGETRAAAAALLAAGFVWAWLEAAPDPRAMLEHLDVVRCEIARSARLTGSVH